MLLIVLRSIYYFFDVSMSKGKKVLFWILGILVGFIILIGGCSILVTKTVTSALHNSLAESPDWVALSKSLNEAFPGKVSKINDQTSNGKRVLVLELTYPKGSDKTFAKITSDQVAKVVAKSVIIKQFEELIVVITEKDTTTVNTDNGSQAYSQGTTANFIYTLDQLAAMAQE